MWRGKSDATQRELHDKYGGCVRIGPNCVLISDPAMIKTIYSTRKPFKKSEFYSAGDTISQGKKTQTLFTTRNEEWHDYLVRPIRSSYSLSSVLRFEQLVDKTLDYLVQQLRAKYATQNNSHPEECPIGNLLHYFAWDVVSEVTFSKRLGALDENPEILQLLKDGERAIDYLGLIGQIPILDTLLKNRFFSVGPPGFKVAADFAAKHLAARIKEPDAGPSSDQDDFIDLFINAENGEEGEGQMTRRQISWLIINVAAGSDTTAAVLRAAVYFVAGDENVKPKLREEINSVSISERNGISWKTCQSLPYLGAVIKEALRLSPAVGLPLERVVPTGGLQLPNGRSIPEGTIVGVNPRVVNHNKNAFGPTADRFVPERWLRQLDETEVDFEARLAKMKDADLTFGFGKRSCIGKNLALMEIYKCVARLFQEFDVSASLLSRLRFSSNHKQISRAHPECEWTVVNGWFVKQYGVDVYLRFRKS